MLISVPFAPSARSTSAFTMLRVAGPPGQATIRKSDAAASPASVGTKRYGTPGCALRPVYAISMPIAESRLAIALPMRPRPRMPAVRPPSFAVSANGRLPHSPART